MHCALGNEQYSLSFYPIASDGLRQNIKNSVVPGGLLGTPVCSSKEFWVNMPLIEETIVFFVEFDFFKAFRTAFLKTVILWNVKLHPGNKLSAYGNMLQ